MSLISKTKANRRTVLSGLLGSALFIPAAAALAGTTASLQALMDAAPIGGTVRVPPGRHILDGPLRIRKPMTLLGGPDVTLVNTIIASPVLEIMSGDVSVSDIEIVGTGVFSHAENVKFKGRGLTTNGDAILIGDRVTPLSNIVLRNISASLVGEAAISVQGARRGGEPIVNNVSIENVTLQGAEAFSNHHAGIYVHGVTGMRISGSNISGFGQCILTTANTRNIEITDCDLHHTSKQHAIYLSGNTEKATITANRMYDLMGTGVKCSAPFTTIADNHIFRARVWGINLKANLNDVSVLNNLIEDCGNDGIDAGFERPDRKQTRIVIAHNRILRAGDFGINFAHDKDNCVWDDIRIEDNLIEGASSAGIRFRWHKVSGSITQNIGIRRNTIRSCGGPAIVMGRKGGSAQMSDIEILENTLIGNGTTKRQAQIVLNQTSVVAVIGNLIDSPSKLKSALDFRGSRQVATAGNQITGQHARQIFQRP